uniref:Uncharacterized protein n=1 Tax=Cyclopterus lumpus TaxID=8103 RepID=A0A8C2WR17_CYCLU
MKPKHINTESYPCFVCLFVVLVSRALLRSGDGWECMLCKQAWGGQTCQLSSPLLLCFLPVSLLTATVASWNDWLAISCSLSWVFLLLHYCPVWWLFATKQLQLLGIKRLNRSLLRPGFRYL